MSPDYSRSDRSRAALLRDAALDRVRRTRRGVIAASALLTAGIAGLVSSVAPGRTLSSSSKASSDRATTTTASVGGASSAIPSMPAPANAGALGLQAPNQAPSSGSQSSQPSPQSSQPSPQSSQPSQPSQSSSAPSQAPAPPPPAPPVVSGGS